VDEGALPCARRMAEAWDATLHDDVTRGEARTCQLQARRGETQAANNKLARSSFPCTCVKRGHLAPEPDLLQSGGGTRGS